jgi:putative endonuclease
MGGYYIYFLTNRSGSTLYVGVTSNLEERVVEHRMKLVPGFTKKYNLTRLVHFEVADNPDSAHAREKQIKGWTRAKKNHLIGRHNPEWRDLAEGWGEPLRKVA